MTDVLESHGLISRSHQVHATSSVGFNSSAFLTVGRSKRSAHQRRSAHGGVQKRSRRVSCTIAMRRRVVTTKRRLSNVEGLEGKRVKMSRRVVLQPPIRFCWSDVGSQNSIVKRRLSLHSASAANPIARAYWSISPREAAAAQSITFSGLTIIGSIPSTAAGTYEGAESR